MILQVLQFIPTHTLSYPTCCMWSGRDQGEKIWILGSITRNQRQIWVSCWRSKMEKTWQESVVMRQPRAGLGPFLVSDTHRVAGMTLFLSDGASSSCTGWSVRHPAERFCIFHWHHCVWWVCCWSEGCTTPNQLFLVSLWIFAPTPKEALFFQNHSTSSLRALSSAPLKSVSIFRHKKSQGLIYSQHHSSFLMCP